MVTGGGALMFRMTGKKNMVPQQIGQMMVIVMHPANHAGCMHNIVIS